MNHSLRGNRGLPTQAGLIKTVLLIVIALIVLGYYGFNLKDAIDSPSVKENLITFWNWILAGWSYLVELIKGLLGK